MDPKTTLDPIQFIKTFKTTLKKVNIKNTKQSHVKKMKFFNLYGLIPTKNSAKRLNKTLEFDQMKM